LSTIHANNSLLTVSRLLDLEVDPNALSAALSAVSAQRLVPRLCPHCRIERSPDEYEVDECARHGVALGCSVFEANSQGCGHCVRGYAGRLPIFEIFTMGAKERIAVEHGRLKDLAELVAQQPCYRSLARSAFELVASGQTSFAAAQAVVGVEIS
ncbi:MAG: hypothetical protein N2690_04220, partial [Rhodocyclaceae bacterium]|nr:hypothetical protein [Rhodocyclaceae bacterium]